MPAEDGYDVVTNSVSTRKHLHACMTTLDQALVRAWIVRSRYGLQNDVQF